MDTTKLAQVIRSRAEQIQADKEHPAKHRQHDAELLRTLARLLEGKTVYKAFGAPGDWGYGTPIGDALAQAYVTPKTNHS